MPRHAPDVEDEDYRVFASYHATSDGRFVGGLKVVRTADRRLLFPFDGAPSIGPYGSAGEARRAAIELGKRVILADRFCPEP